MTYIERAIKLAIVGGYKEGENWKFVSANQYWVVWLNGNNNEVTVNTNVYFLDKNFWVALGKSLGWSDVYRDHDENSVEECWCKPKVILNGGAFITVHNDLTTKGRFTEFMTDYIYDGKTPESYFKELLKGE